MNFEDGFAEDAGGQWWFLDADDVPEGPYEDRETARWARFDSVRDYKAMLHAENHSEAP